MNNPVSVRVTAVAEIIQLIIDRLCTNRYIVGWVSPWPCQGIATDSAVYVHAGSFDYCADILPEVLPLISMPIVFCEPGEWPRLIAVRAEPENQRLAG